MKLSSPAFANHEEIGRKYTCEGEDVSPPLAWTGVPEAAKTLVLVVEDPDAPDPAAPKRIWTHWVLFDLPPDCRGLDEGADGDGLPTGTRVGLNDWKRADWGGPCPPIGRHRYFFRLFALDISLGPRGPIGRADVLEALEGHVLAKAELVGTYEKER
jgi:Raf kinase inhibitor-like YbhB/YbcL family protein